MIRHMLCQKCGEEAGLDEVDMRSGFHQRKVYLSSKVPKHHGITFNGQFSPLPDLVCDRCSKVITGEVSVAVTTWRGPEPREWESEYGTILPAQAVAVLSVLTNEPKPK